MSTQKTALANLGRSKLDSILRVLTVAFALALVGFTTPLVVADHMGNHERGAESTECGTAKPEATDTPETATVDPLRASIHRHEPRNK